MAFSFEPFLAISAGHFMAVLAGPEQYLILGYLTIAISFLSDFLNIKA